MPKYYIGLSYLSTNKPKARKEQRAEARRLLSLFEGRPISDNDIAMEENGRPFFPGRRTDFNITHSKNMVAVSMVNGPNIRTGCDIELVRPRVKALEIAEEFFSASERNYAFSGGERSGDQARFYHIWTLKECFLKLHGLTVFDMARAPSFIGNDGCLHCDFDNTVFNLYELSGSNERYILAAAIEGGRQLQPSIQWFSRSFLPVKSITEIKAALSPDVMVSPNI